MPSGSSFGLPGSWERRRKSIVKFNNGNALTRERFVTKVREVWYSSHLS